MDTGSGLGSEANGSPSESVELVSFSGGVLFGLTDFVFEPPRLALRFGAGFLRGAVALVFGATAGETALTVTIRLFFRALSFLRASLAERFACLNALRFFFSSTFAVWTPFRAKSACWRASAICRRRLAIFSRVSDWEATGLRLFMAIEAKGGFGVWLGTDSDTPAFYEGPACNRNN